MSGTIDFLDNPTTLSELALVSLTEVKMHRLRTWQVCQETSAATRVVNSRPANPSVLGEVEEAES